MRTKINNVEDIKPNRQYAIAFANGDYPLIWDGETFPSGADLIKLGIIEVFDITPEPELIEEIKRLRQNACETDGF